MTDKKEFKPDPYDPFYSRYEDWEEKRLKEKIRRVEEELKKGDFPDDPIGTVERQAREIVKKLANDARRAEEFSVGEIKKLDDYVSKGVKEIEKLVNPHKGVVIIIGIGIVFLVIGVIVYFNYDPKSIVYGPVDIEIKNSSGLPMNVFYNKKQMFSLSGWESTLEYNEKDRLYGNEQYKKIVFDDNGKAYTQLTLDNQVRLDPLTTDPEKVTRIGWFVNSDKKEIEEKTEKRSKIISLRLTSIELNTNFTYRLYKNKPFFYADITVITANESNIGEFALGFVLKDFYILLPNGTKLRNDNNVTSLDKNLDLVITGEVTQESKEKLKEKIEPEIKSKKAVDREGSYYDLENIEYEIFLNKKHQGIIVFTEQPTRFENLFNWNVFRIYLTPESGKHPRSYFIILDDASLKYDEEAEDWEIKDKYFSGYVEEYINNVFYEIE